MTTTVFGTVACGSGTSISSFSHALASNSVAVTGISPSWNTTVWVYSKSTNAVTIRFSTQIDSGGGRYDWRVDAP